MSREDAIRFFASAASRSRSRSSRDRRPRVSLYRQATSSISAAGPTCVDGHVSTSAPLVLRRLLGGDEPIRCCADLRHAWLTRTSSTSISGAQSEEARPPQARAGARSVRAARRLAGRPSGCQRLDGVRELERFVREALDARATGISTRSSSTSAVGASALGPLPGKHVHVESRSSSSASSR